MAMITCLSLLPPPSFPFIKKANPPNPCLMTSLSTPFRPKLTIYFKQTHQRKSHNWRIFAAPEQALAESSEQISSSSEQIVSNSDGGTGNIISVLLFIAFIVLFILTIGVIYLGVTDFLEKREKEKFETEEAGKKKGKGKGKARARAGPRGFGQKTIENDDFDD